MQRLHRFRALGLAGAIMLWLPLTGCGGPEGEGAAFRVRDSTGIRITEAGAPESADSTGWVPALVLGDDETGPEFQFDQIGGLVLRGDGSLVVANGGTQQLRFFGPEGQFIRSVGRAGSGPGEYSRTIKLVAYARDSLLVWDFIRRQATVLDRDGQLARSFAITAAEPNPTVIGAFSDGSLLVGSRNLRLAPGLNTDSVVFQRLAPDGSPLRALGWYRTSMVHFQMTATGPVIDEHPFTPRADVAVVEGGFLVAPGDRAVLQQVDLSGRPVSEHRWAVPATVLDPAAVAEWKRQDLANQPNAAARAQRQGWLDDLSLPPTAPVVAGVRVADDGTRWVRRFDLAPTRTRFDRLSSEGRWLETVTLPARFELLAATAGAVAGVLRDADGVEQVAVFRRPDR